MPLGRVIACGTVAVASLAIGAVPVRADSASRPSSPSVARPSSVYPPDGRKWLPLRVPGSRAVRGAHGAVAQVVELRGWLTFVGDRCYSEDPAVVAPAKLNRREPDWHYNLELDPAWLAHLGVRDPNTIVRPGNVINWSTRLPQPGDALGHETGPLATRSAWALIARPIVHVEVTSWDPARHRGQQPPAGWQRLAVPGCASNILWPYDPRNPVRGQPPLAPGQYVRIVGSLVTDDPHVRINEEEADYASENRAVHGILGGDDPTTLAVRLFWEQERPANSPLNGSRWTELHPPDRVEIVQHPPRRDAQMLRSVLVAPPPDLPTGQPFTFDYVLPLPPSASAAAVPKVTEIVGADTRPRTLHGRATPPPGQRVTVSNSDVHFHITVTRHGGAGTPSAFQAAYLVTP